MQIVLKPNYRNSKINDKYAGMTVDVDTTHLHTNCYNTTTEFDSFQVEDIHIARVIDDARINKGRCKYCGKIVEKGHENEHFEEMEKKQCQGQDDQKDCFWNHKRYDIIDRKVETKGDIEVETITKKIRYECTYKEDANNKIKSGDVKYCVNTEHRRYGIEWFTPDNTFFLRYPNGYNGTAYDLGNKAPYFVRLCRNTRVEYGPKLGSYGLYFKMMQDADRTDDDYTKGTFEYMYLHNNNVFIKFTYDPKNDLFIICDHSHMKTSKYLLNNSKYAINKKINEQIRNLMREIVVVTED